MDSHQSDDENQEVSINKPSHDELQNEFNEFHDECLKLSRLCTKEKKLVSSLEGKCKSMQDELDKVKSNINTKIYFLTCNRCASLESQIDELN